MINPDYKRSLKILKRIKEDWESAKEEYKESHNTLKNNTIEIFLQIRGLYALSMMKLDKTYSQLEFLELQNRTKNTTDSYGYQEEIEDVKYEIEMTEKIISNLIHILEPIEGIWDKEDQDDESGDPEFFYNWVVQDLTINQLKDFLTRAQHYYESLLEAHTKERRIMGKILKEQLLSIGDKELIEKHKDMYKKSIEEKTKLKEITIDALRSIDRLTKLVKTITGKKPKMVSDLFISKTRIDEYYSQLYRERLHELSQAHLSEIEREELRLPPEEAFSLLGIKVEDVTTYQWSLIEERRLTEDGLNEILQSIAEKKMSQYTPVDKIHLVTEGNEHFPPKIYLPKESKVSELLEIILKDDLNVFFLLQYGFESIGDKLTEYTEPIRTGVFATWVYLRSKYPKSRLLLFSEMIEDLANNEYYEDNGNYYVIDVERLWDNIKRRYRKELADREKRRNYLKERLRVKMNLAASLVVYEKFTGSDCGKDDEYLEELIIGYQEMLLDNIDNVPETAGENIFNILERKKKRLYNGEKNGNGVDEYVTEDPINDRFKVDDDTREYLEKCKISHEVVEYVITYGVRRKGGDLATNDSYIPRELVYKNTKRALKRDGREDLIPKIKETINFLVRKGILFEHKNGNTLSINYKDSPDEELVYLQERIKQYIYLIRNHR